MMCTYLLLHKNTTHYLMHLYSLFSKEMLHGLILDVHFFNFQGTASIMFIVTLYKNNMMHMYVDSIWFISLAIAMKAVDFQQMELLKVAQPIVHLFNVLLPT